MNIIDLARGDRARRAAIEVVGIRPGEKLHETLISAEEARRTFDLGWCYVVEPEHAFWSGRGAADGSPVEADFVYSSDRNTQWLDIAELRQLLTMVPAPAAATATPAG